MLNTRVTAARFDEASTRWTVRTDQGDELSARSCIMAMGCLSKPKTPEVPGLETFAGDVYHTAYWPQGGVDFAGRRVGVIGTGSSGIQAIPIMADQADQLTVFQRTANFSLPAFNRPIDQQLVASIKADYLAVRQADRMSGFGVAVGTPTRSALEVSEAERQAAYQAGWDRGNLTGVLLDLHRPAHQRGRERDRCGVRARHDPADGPRPGQSRDPLPRGATRSVPSAPAWTPATTTPSTATT